jgi:hypothetical protein
MLFPENKKRHQTALTSNNRFCATFADKPDYGRQMQYIMSIQNILLMNYFLRVWKRPEFTMLQSNHFMYDGTQPMPTDKVAAGEDWPAEMLVV